MKIIIILLAGYYFFAACAREGKSEGKEIIKIEVNHYRVPCVGAGTQLCYLTRQDNEAEWEYLFESINGFQYQWGKVYELEVEKSYRKDVKADQSAISYKLIRIVSSKDAPGDQPFAVIVKDADMVAIKNDNGDRSLLGQYPVSCITPVLCEELDTRLRSQAYVTALFQHSPDHQSLVLQSLKN